MLIEPYHLLANLITSDASEFGVRVFRHLQKNLREPALSFLSLKNSMIGTPAIVVGAGPSLQTQVLKQWKDFGLIIAAGTAIQVLDVEPDLAVAIDPHVPLLRRKFTSVPLCFQGRVHPDSLKRVNGAKFYLPDTHFLFEPWLMGQEIFSSGWTVGNTAVAMAAHLGCDPIILIGMDYCYRNKQKYAGQKGGAAVPSLVKAVDEKGQEVETQADWLFAIRWMEEFAARDPSRQWINATVGGMKVGGPFSSCALDEVHRKTSGVIAKWSAAMKGALPIAMDRSKLAEWKASLKRCKAEPEGEIACELLLEPLWRIWEPLFERELMTDTQPLSMAEKLQIQKHLFFEQVIDEHLGSLRCITLA
jgi:hypothetical protein